MEVDAEQKAPTRESYYEYNKYPSPQQQQQSTPAQDGGHRPRSFAAGLNEMQSSAFSISPNQEDVRSSSKSKTAPEKEIDDFIILLLRRTKTAINKRGHDASLSRMGTKWTEERGVT